MTTQPTAASLRAAKRILKATLNTLKLLNETPSVGTMAAFIDAAGMAEVVDVIRELIDAMLSVAGWDQNFDKITGKELPMTRPKQVAVAEAKARVLLQAHHMNPEPLPGHEILTEPFLRQWGAVEGMKTYWPKAPETGWMETVYKVGQIIRENDLHQIVFSAPLGTMAMVATELPDGHECQAICSNCKNEQHDQFDRICDVCGIAALVNNRLVKVLPGLLAGLKEKPEGLVWANIGTPDWTDWGFDNMGAIWPPLSLQEPTGNFAYALPAQVLAEIEEKKKKCDCHAGDIDANEHHASCPLSITTSEEVKICPSKSFIATSAEGITPTANALGSNAAPPKSQPSEVAATEKPWRVVITTPIFERHECEVVDIGYADRILTVNCAELDSRLAAIPATSPAADEMLAFIQANCLTVECYDSPTPGGDDVQEMWRVIEYHMQNPRERYIGYGDTPAAAIAQAMQKEGK